MSPTVGIVGGGLAGMAAAVALNSAQVPVELFEWRRRLGGRATSFRDPESGELIDHCQHVSMACCTNLADFCRRTNIADLFRRERVLNFFGPDGVRCRFKGSTLLPAPLHLAPAFARLSYLSRAERNSIASALWTLARLDPAALPDETAGQWLRSHGQSARALDLFWNVVLVSALGEDLDRAGLRYARQVFVEGFLANSHAYELEIPIVSLSALYGERLLAELNGRGVRVHLGSGAARLDADDKGPLALVLHDGRRRNFDYIVVAVPWHKVAKLFPTNLWKSLPELERISRIQAAPISGVHLWFDRQITDLPHAVLTGTLCQWFFARGRQDRDGAAEHYYQVVISASRDLAGQDREEIVRQIHAELANCFPDAKAAVLVRHRIVTEQAAVFSATPEIDALRPPAQSSIPHILWAGDWIATGWPATMEGAVRGGYLAAEAVLQRIGRPRTFIQPNLPPSMLAKRLFAFV